MPSWSELQDWQPDMAKIKTISREIQETFATTLAAEKGKMAEDV